MSSNVKSLSIPPRPRINTTCSDLLQAEGLASTILTFHVFTQSCRLVSTACSVRSLNISEHGERRAMFCEAQISVSGKGDSVCNSEPMGGQGRPDMLSSDAQ